MGAPGIAGLKDLDRGVATVADDGALGIIAVAIRPSPPADAFKVIVGIKAFGVRMDAAKEEVAGGTAVGRDHAVGHGLGQRADQHKGQAWVHLGVAGHLRARVLDINNCPRRRNDVHGAITALVFGNGRVG